MNVQPQHEVAVRIEPDGYTFRARMPVWMRPTFERCFTDRVVLFEPPIDGHVVMVGTLSDPPESLAVLRGMVVAAARRAREEAGAEPEPEPPPCTPEHALLVRMLNRLYWLVTSAPGVANYADDVELFTRAAIGVGAVDRQEGEKLIDSYCAAHDR